MDRVYVARTEQDRTPPAVSAALESQRDLLCTAHRLPVANDAVRLTAKDQGKNWIEQHLGWIAQIVQHPPKLREM